MTDVPEDWHVRRKRYDALMATELGQLYHAYERALTDYWQGDVDNDQQMMALDKASKEATHAFVTKLMELAGV